MNELNANENENQKIINFMEISKINDRELAKKYLLSSNYNEAQALNKYFSINNNQNKLIKDKEINKNKLNDNNIQQNEIINDNSNNGDNENFINRYIISPIMSLISFCAEILIQIWKMIKKYFTFYQTKLKNFPNSISI